MFKSSKSSLSSVQTLIALLNELQDVTKAVIKLLSVMEKQHIEVPVPSWIMNQTVGAKIAIVQIYQACTLIQQRAALKKSHGSEPHQALQQEPVTQAVTLKERGKS
jgi:hypothetical protein